MFFSKSLCTYAVFAIIQLMIFIIAPNMPNSMGWENGPIENTQVILLSAAAAWAFWCAHSTTTVRLKTLWIVVGVLWSVMAFRELSWGAAFHLPLTMDVEVGPQFSSSHQLWYKPAVAPVLACIALLSAGAFYYSKQHHTFVELFRQSSLPITELIIFCVLMISASAAEGHMGLNLGMNKGTAQVYEEAVELLAYGALVLAQYRVMKGLSRIHTADA